MEAIIESAKELGLIFAQVIVAIFFCLKYIKGFMKEEDIPMGVRHQNEIDVEITKEMERAKEIMMADHIMLFEFHNGQHYSSYRTALKMSPSYEVYRAGRRSLMSKCSCIPISVMPYLISEITKKGESYCKNIEQIKDTMPGEYSFKKSIGVGAYYDLAIKNDCNEVVGFVAIEWSTKMPDIDKEEAKKLAWFLECKVKKLIEKQDKKKKRK